jgi:hypothetical protein
MSHIKADVGVLTHGNATLSFYLAVPGRTYQDARAAQQHSPEGSVRQEGSPQGEGSYQEEGRRRVGERGEHLFTLDLAAQLVASNVKFVPASAQQNDTFRLSVDMHIVEGSLWHQVRGSIVGWAWMSWCSLLTCPRCQVVVVVFHLPACADVGSCGVVYIQI